MNLAEFEIPARAEFVALARLVMSSLVDDRYELTEDQLDNLKLALSEACIMAIEAQGGSNDGMIEITCVGNHNKFDVVVDSRGQFTEHAVDDERMSIQQELGLPLISSLVDDTNVDPIPATGGSRLRMTVYCDRAEEL